MSRNDYNRQAARRQRIRKTTLIVGVDIGNAFNAMGFMNKEGNVLCKCAKLYNNREGFEKFLDMIEGLKKEASSKGCSHRDGTDGTLLEEAGLFCERAWL
jgi:hypothetical protein